MSNELFKKKPESESLNVSVLTKWTKADIDKVRHGAAIRNISVREFIRRAALGRRADVDFETDIVLSLGQVTRAIRQLHKQAQSQHVNLPEQEMLALIAEAREAIRKISN